MRRRYVFDADQSDVGAEITVTTDADGALFLVNEGGDVLEYGFSYEELPDLIEALKEIKAAHDREQF